MAPVSAGAPTTDFDMYAEEAVRDAQRADGMLRELGAAVYLERYDIWAVGRHEHVRAIVEDWETYSSASRPFHDPATVRPEILVTDDPPKHTAVRAVIQRALSPVVMKRLREDFEREAERHVERLLADGIVEVDGHRDIAAGYVVKVFPDAVGLPAEGREHVLVFGDVAFNTFGPPNEIFQASMARSAEAVEWVGRVVKRDALDPDGIGMQMYAAADAGEISEDDAELLVLTLLAAGADTTVFAIGNLLHAFVDFPEQWQLLRDDPSQARAAFEEILRYDCPARIGGRITTRDVELDGIAIPAGSRLQLLWLAAGRDPRRWDEPERYDLTRRAAGQHIGFGYGIHQCVGQAVARMEGECLLRALAQRVERIELAGEPEPALNLAAHGHSKLPLRLHAA